MAEHLLCKQGVVGSIPIVSTKNHQVTAFRRGLVESPGRSRAHYVPVSIGHGGHHSAMARTDGEGRVATDDRADLG